MGLFILGLSGGTVEIPPNRPCLMPIQRTNTANTKPIADSTIMPIVSTKSNFILLSRPPILYLLEIAHQLIYSVVDVYVIFR